MIELSQETIDAHPLMGHLKVPPTHAICIMKRYVHSYPGVKMSREMSLTVRDNTISAVYAYGTIVDGQFIGHEVVESIETFVDLTQESGSNGIMMMDGMVIGAKAAAAANLTGAGVAPTPGDPNTPLIVPTKKNDFKECDLDAVIAFYTDALKGTVVPNPE